MRHAKLLLLLVLEWGLHAQTAVLDDFSAGVRLNANGQPLFTQQQGKSLTISGGKLQITPWTGMAGISASLIVSAISAPGFAPAPWGPQDCSSPYKCVLMTFASSVSGILSLPNPDSSGNRGWTFHNLNVSGSDCSSWTSHSEITSDQVGTFVGIQLVDSTHAWFQFNESALNTSTCTFTPPVQIYNNCSYSGCGMTLEFQTYPYNVYPAGWAHNYVMSGQTFNAASMNRLKFDITPDHDIIVPEGSTVDSPISFGYYFQNRTNDAPSQEGGHAYGGTGVNLYAGRTYHAMLTRKFNHMNCCVNTEGFPEDMSMFNGMNGHIHELETRFYVEMLGKNISGPQWAATHPVFDNFAYDSVPNEPDGMLFSLFYGYTGNVPGTTSGRYDIGFKADSNQGGFIEFRYSTADMKANGFSSGTLGTQKDLSYSSSDQYVWHSPDMAEAPTMYVGMRPHFQVGKAVTGPNGDVIVSTGDVLETGWPSAGGVGDTLMSTGDTVRVSGVTGCTQANGDFTVTVLPRKGFSAFDYATNPNGTPGTLVDVEVLDTSGNTLVTTTIPHGLTVGRIVRYIKNDYYFSAGTPVTEVVDATHFKFKWLENNVPWTPPVGHYPGAPYNRGFIYAYEALQLNGSGACSAPTSSRNTNAFLVSTNDTENFMQLAIPAQSSVCSISPSSVGPYTTGQSVSTTFSAANCSASSWSATGLSGSGLSLNASTGALTGTAVAGTYSVTVAYDTASAPFTLTVDAGGSGGGSRAGGGAIAGGKIRH